MNKKLLVYIADLTHTGPVLCSEVFPFAAGLIGASLIKHFPDQVKVEIFKFPDDLNAALERARPDIMGFSNYSWNLNLSYDCARAIKAKYPETVVVFGGPNYDLSDRESGLFWKRYPKIDFNIIQEGEIAIVHLVKKLLEFDFSVDALKASNPQLPNCHYLWDGKLIKNAALPRMTSLQEIPSPYLLGLMDKFFDHRLFPLTHSTRGCPFHCTYCSEGASYYNKVLHSGSFAEEMEYIAQRSKHSPVLYLSDANFGMYTEDLEKAKILREMQDKYGYPKHVIAATGKNQRARVIEVVKTIRGAMFVSTAIQSTDAQVLKNVERENISLEGLTEIAAKTKEAGANTYTELILCLPGDSITTHQKSLRDAVDSGQGVVRMYQLIMLAQTKLYSPENEEKFGIKTRFRVMPRSYGSYRILGQDFISVEAEKICVGNNTMTEAEYLLCRELDMSIEIIHNGSPFFEFWHLCKAFGIPWFDLILAFHNDRENHDSGLKDLYVQFRKDNVKGYWPTWDDLQADVKNNFSTYTENTAGTNEMSKAKALAFFRLSDKIHDLMDLKLREILKARNLWMEEMGGFLDGLKRYCALKKQNVFSSEVSYEDSFNYDYKGLFALVPERESLVAHVVCPSAQKYRFHIDAKQKAIIGAYAEQYGTSTIDGLGRILMRSRLENLMRQIEVLRGAETGSLVAAKNIAEDLS